MSLKAQFKTNPDRESEGVSIEFGPNEDGSIPTFLVSRAGKSNKAYTKGLELATRPYRRQIELGTMNEALAESLFMGVFINTVLKGWMNVTLADVTGDDTKTGFAPFSTENAKALFALLPEMYDDLQDKSKNASMFRDETLEVEAKN